MTGSAVLRWETPAAGAAPLLVLPPAGVAVGRYRAWADWLGPAADVLGVQLPGRERRWRDPHPESLASAAEGIADELEALAGSRPVTIYGHSFGGLLGYELACRLVARRAEVRALVVGGCRAPELWPGAGERLLADLANAADPWLADSAELDADMQAILLDLLGKDARLAATFTGPYPQPLPCPIVAVAGCLDGFASPEQMRGWQGHTAASFRLLLVDGGHFFHDERPEPLRAALTGLLRDAVAREEI
jgi:surfactin synthase thioesterase subunit